VAKLRHLALSVPDPEVAARFYEKAFGLKRLRQNHEAITLADGVVSVSLIQSSSPALGGDGRGKDFVGVHHFGFIVDDLEETGRLIKANGGVHHSDPDPKAGMTAETKYLDPNGIVFDIVRPDQAWKGAS